jgi:hypothetical protein
MVATDNKQTAIVLVCFGSNLEKLEVRQNEFIWECSAADLFIFLSMKRCAALPRRGGGSEQRIIMFSWGIAINAINLNNDAQSAHGDSIFFCDARVIFHLAAPGGINCFLL